MINPTSEEEGLEVVLVGSFNPRIISPGWLSRFEFITDAELTACNVRMANNEVSHFDARGVQILCLKERINFITSDPSRFEMMQDWILNIFNLLPHTPMTAAGINSYVHYLVRDESRWNRIGHTLVPK